MRVAIALISTISMWAQVSQPSDFRGWMNQGVQLFRNAQYQEAIDAFQRAESLKPDDPNVHLYLGTVYMQMWVPGAASPENLAMGNRAEVEFKRALQLNPNDTTALASLTSLSYNQASAGADYAEKIAKFEEAREWNARLLAIAPQDKEAHYWAGVIVWSEYYPALMTARAAAHLKAADPGPLTTAARFELLNKYGQMVDDGMEHLRRALIIDPQYEDAMAYLNLLIRERADLRDTPEQYKQDVQEADDWLQRVLDTKKQKAQRDASGGQVAGQIGGIDVRAGMLTSPQAVPPPEPPAAASAQSNTVGGIVNNGPANPAPQRIRISGDVERANLIRKVDPVCPALAVQARIQGMVHFSLIVDKNGQVQNIQVISGHPLLVPAALDAVKQWQYRPTLLNGAPVEVMTQVEVKVACAN